MESYPDHRRLVTAIEIGAETETGAGWSYQVTVTWEEGEPTSHTVALSWVDHDELSGGVVAPSRVVEAVIRSLTADPVVERLPDRFDAATARRWIPDLGDRLDLG